ncbi:E3 ubiquitin-protein ligase Trim36-like [Saccostrea echinata]|uniref:E3 ubiquitin-protein ligase Trim36-like n=1 Tax=Saccostrea echinata TaxID=191078 RepID=UPI002A80C27F|nr:E3 ubiquitin-protein ligase Trim36-like [Saccostrea echinata]
MATSLDFHARAQDIKRCQLCPGKDRKSATETVCNTCHVNLCKDCVGHHMISSPTIRHDVVTFQFKKSEIIPPQCNAHGEMQCEMFCEQCNSPICQKCLASGSHENHNVPHISAIYSSKQELIRKDLNELETSIAPVYESILSELKKMLSSIEQKHNERQRTIDEFGKIWHKLVDKVIKKYQSDARKMERDDVNAIKNLEADFQIGYLLIQSAMDDNKSILASNDPSKLVNYTSENEKFRTVHSRFELIVSEFSPKELTEQALFHIIGDIPETVKTSIQGQVLKAPHSNPSSEKAIKKCLDLPLTVGEINTDEEICQLACIPHTDQFYVSGVNGIIKHMNKEGEVLRKITTENIELWALTVTRKGNLVYIKKEEREINIVEGEKIKCLLQVQDWMPDAICSTYTDNILVHMTFQNTMKWIQRRKVVRYSGSKVTQVIQLSDLDLFSIFVHCIDENKNFDIIVSEQNSVLVLNNKGQFRFNYNGMKYKYFTPHGITTDSMCHILIADRANNIIRIIDQNGQFLLHLDNCKLHPPCNLSIDSNDILYVVADNHKVKRIKYME